MIPREIIHAFLFVVAILSATFFVCGFLHLCRILHKNRGSGSSLASEELDDPEMTRTNPFQRQLQQLFRLHDSGLDQAFVDALPVFFYKDIVKGEEHFDCAVCLCEFSEEDKLRLLPPCGHAFHIECIDTWLLSNSTCPLCRGSLYYSLGFGIENTVSEFNDHGEEEDADVCSGVGDCHIVVSSKRVFSVRLGKLRGIPEGSDRGGFEISMEETISSSSLDARRCYSMGSYRYVVSDTELQVETCAPEVRNGEQHSERHTRRKLVEPESGFDDKEAEGMRIGIGTRGESFSVSKIWQWSNKKRNSKLTNMSTNSHTNQ